MAMTPEGKVKKAVKLVLESVGAYYVMPVTGGYGNQGAPDFLVCHKGLFYGIETKAGKGKTTALQDLHLENIKKAGGVSLIVRETDIEALKTLLTTGECHARTESNPST